MSEKEYGKGVALPSLLIILKQKFRDGVKRFQALLSVYAPIFVEKELKYYW